VWIGVGPVREVVMLVLLILASAATFVGVHQLVGQFRGTTVQLDRESTIVVSLRTEIVDNAVSTHVPVAADVSRASPFARLGRPIRAVEVCASVAWVPVRGVGVGDVRVVAFARRDSGGCRAVGGVAGSGGVESGIGEPG
jgi:hypothetical protein